MSSITVIAEFLPKAGKTDTLESVLVECIPAVHAESGCELYALQRASTGQLFLIEKWTTKADLEAHATGEAVKILNSKIADLIAEPVRVTEMVAVPAGTENQGKI